VLGFMLKRREMVTIKQDRFPSDPRRRLAPGPSRDTILINSD
jgi:hypothetical protein